MIRITVISLLLGTALLALGLTQLFPPENAYNQDTAAVLWNAEAADVSSGKSTLTDSALQLELDGAGDARVSLAMAPIAAKNFSFVHLAVEESSAAMILAITWTDAQNPDNTSSYIVESHRRQSLWLATEELRGWEGEIGNIGLSITGRAGDTIRIRDFSIYPASPSRQLLAVFSDLTSYAPWNRAAMNTHTGVFNASSFYPIPLVVGIFLFSLCSYGVLVLIFRTRLQFQSAVVALIFLAAWISLDLIWQKRLWHQAVETHQTFSGKATPEKLAVGPDAELIEFVWTIKPLLAPPDSRVFVASSDTYQGMRVAYYLYPFNVYWSPQPQELPEKRFFGKGDYVAVVNPSKISFNREKKQLLTANKRRLSAELLYSDAYGTLVRLN